MKQARIVERKPTTRGNRFWYELEAVAPASVRERPLQNATARSRRDDPFQVDLDDQRAAIASLNAWAKENGWTVVEEEKPAGGGP